MRQSGSNPVQNLFKPILIKKYVYKWIVCKIPFFQLEFIFKPLEPKNINFNIVINYTVITKKKKIRCTSPDTYEYRNEVVSHHDRLRQQ